MSLKREMDGPYLRNSSIFVDDPSAGVFRVNQSVYTSSEVLARERKTVLANCWLYLGHASEVRKINSFVTRNVAGRELIFTRSSSGELIAFYNSCRHRGAMLCREARGTRGVFACPYHGWLFNDRGELIKIPGRESFAVSLFSGGDLDLKRVARIDSWCEFVFVCFSPDVIPLAEYLADAGDVLQQISEHGPQGMEILPGTHEYSIRANWKLLIENSNDGYHAGPTHASYFDYVRERDGAFASDDSATRLVDTPAIAHGVSLLGNGHSFIATEGPWGRPCARWVASWGEDARAEIEATRQEIIARTGEKNGHRITQHDKNIILFPNTMINDVMGIAIRTCQPTAPDQTSVSAWSLAPVGETPVARDRRNRSYLEFFGPSGFATPDDIEMLSMCQRMYCATDGENWNDISKGVGKAEMAVDDEEQQRHFWRRWREIVDV